MRMDKLKPLLMACAMATNAALALVLLWTRI